MMTLLGKGILVVGETSGIGFGVAQARCGWHCRVNSILPADAPRQLELRCF